MSRANQKTKSFSIVKQDEAWEKLIAHAVSGKPQRSFNVRMTITVKDQTWSAYGAEVSHRDIMFFCKQGTATFVIDTYGDRHTTELFDWERENESP